MRKNLQHTITKDALKKLRGDSAAERLLHRLHSVVLVLNGLSSSEVARIYHDSPRAVAYWVKRYEEKGIIGLQEESRTGRPSLLNPIQMKKLQFFLNQSRERSQPVSAPTLAKYIQKQFEIVLTIRQCSRILKRFM